MKIVIRYIIVFVGLISAYLLFGIVSNLLPNKPIIRNVTKTVDRGDLKSETDCYAIVRKTAFRLDHFTDAIILNQACNGGRDNLIDNVLLVPRFTTFDSECEGLKHYVAGDSTLTKATYARYWHGSTFLMRWMLLFTNYITLRLLFYFISSLLIIWVCIALYRRLGILFMGCYMASLLCVNVFVMQFSIQYMPVLVIGLGSTLWVLYRVKKSSQMVMTLFITGSLTAYFDLLTCPVLTWGMPLCVYILMQEKDSFRNRLINIVVPSVMWAAGYALTWMSKWVIATLLTSESVVKDSISQFLLRTDDVVQTESISRLFAMIHNISQVSWVGAGILILVLVGLAIIRFRREGMQTAVLCFLMAIPPLLWYLALANHSQVHFWFTYRSMAVVLMAVFFSIASLIRNKNIELGKR